MTENKEILFHLKELSALQMDSITGFQQIEDKCGDDVHKQLFRQFGKESLSMWEELNAEIINYGGTISTKGSVKGAINHLWMKIKANFNGEIKTILDSIDDCESINLDRYKSVLSTEDPKLYAILNRHIHTIENRLMLIRKICEEKV